MEKRSNAVRLQLAILKLKQDPQQPNRKIACACGLDHKTVAALRARLKSKNHE